MKRTVPMLPRVALRNYAREVMEGAGSALRVSPAQLSGAGVYFLILKVKHKNDYVHF